MSRPKLPCKWYTGAPCINEEKPWSTECSGIKVSPARSLFLDEPQPTYRTHTHQKSQNNKHGLLRNGHTYNTPRGVAITLRPKQQHHRSQIWCNILQPKQAQTNNTTKTKNSSSFGRQIQFSQDREFLGTIQEHTKISLQKWGKRDRDLTLKPFNISGLTAAKLHHVIHHIRRNTIDVMVLISAQITEQKG